MFTIKQYDLGDEIERVGYYQDVIDDMQESKKNISNKPKIKYEIPEEVRLERNRERAIQRAKTKIRRLTQRYNLSYMWTLTFAQKEVVTYNPVNKKESVYDSGDYDDAWRLWKSFLKRCKDRGLEFDYIVTIEVQEKRLETYGEKVYHFHFITNKVIPQNYDNAKKSGKKYNMTSLWGHGHVFVTKKKSKKKLTHLYIVKYISKLIDEMGPGKQRYRARKDMDIPVERRTVKDHLEFFKDLVPENIKTSNYNIMGDLELFWLIYEKDPGGASIVNRI